MFPLITVKLLTSRFFCIALRISLYLLYLLGGYLITLSFEARPSFLDSLLFVIVTVTTIGYGNVTPDTNVAKCLVVAFVLLGTVMSTVFGNPVGNLVNSVGDKLEKWFFQSINTTSDKTKQMWKSFFAIVWILFVVGTGILGIWIWDAKEMSDTTQPNHNGVNATDCSVLNATDFSVVNATYFSVVSAYTIGYGEFHFSATAGKLFASVWLPLGTAVVSSATSYLCGHRRWICAVCIWNGKKTRIVPGQEFDKGTLVEANPTLRKHCLEHTNVENSPKFLSGVLSSRIYECKFAQRQDLEPVHTCSREFSSTPEEVQILLKREDCCSKELGSSYRWRGTYNFMANALNEMQRRAFICTVGKHAVTVACVAQLLNSEARVVIPVDYFSAEQVKVFGVEERTRSVMAWSFHKGKRVLLEKQNGEVLVEAIGEECFSICAEFLDGIIIVDEHVISTANEYIKRDTIKKVSALCIAGVQCYCTKYVQEVRQKTIVAVIDEYEDVLS